ncbi:MAG: cytochrome-c peroxidase [Chitinophagaceae bacterium]|nr:cytochrome-c peroxidase [Chitinophagaceae bacterium]
MHKKHYYVIIFLLATFFACKKEVFIEPFIGFYKPAHFPEIAYNINNNPITQEGFELGRKLFYDPILSADNTISCGSCHLQSNAFTHHGHDVSHGIFDRLGTRNSPAIMNMAWSKSFMWDGGIVDLDLLPIAPITNPVEMDEQMPRVLQKLRNHKEYPTLFKKVYGTDEITTSRFLKSLSQFMLLCISDNAKYDSVQRNQAVFTTIEQEGFELFKVKCGNCHKEPLFTDHSFRNNGLSASNVNDKGRFEITLNNADKYTFKVPSLRNLGYTSPYMHDGRFITLDAALEHYNSGVSNLMNLDPSLQQNGTLGIALTTSEKQKIIAFLNTLNDRNFVTKKLLAEQ